LDVVNEIEILETDVKDCNEKCQRVNCNAIYDAIMSSLKLMYDYIFMCCARGPEKGHPPSGRKKENGQYYFLYLKEILNKIFKTFQK
jgi:hypothetical protein